MLKRLEAVRDATFEGDFESFKSALESAPSESDEFSKLWDTIVVPGVVIKVEISIGLNKEPPMHIIVESTPAKKLINLLGKKKADRVFHASSLLVAAKYKFASEVAKASRKESAEKFYREAVEAWAAIKAGEASREASRE